MLVDERMSQKVYTVPPEMPIHDAMAMFQKNQIHRAVVMKDGKMLGIVSVTDLQNASPSPVTTLSIWEINHLMSKVTVKHVMTKKVKTLEVGTPIEEAARIMADARIGGMPVTREGKVVGMITETHLFRILLELMGAREKGVRVSAIVEDKPGQIAKVSKAIAEAGGNFIAFGMFTGPEDGLKLITFKVSGIKKEDIKKVLSKEVKKFLDIR